MSLCICAGLFKVKVLFVFRVKLCGFSFFRQYRVALGCLGERVKPTSRKHYFHLSAALTGRAVSLRTQKDNKFITLLYDAKVTRLVNVAQFGIHGDRKTETAHSLNVRLNI